MALNPYQQAQVDAGSSTASEMNPMSAGADIAKLLNEDGDLVGGSEEPTATPEPEQEEVQEETPAEVQDTPAEEAELEAEAETEEGEGEDPFTTVEDLAGALDLSVEDFLSSLKVKIKAAGTEHEATLADAVTGYQLKADYDRDKTALSETRKKANALHQKEMEEVQKQAVVQEAYFAQAKNTYQQTLNSPQMQQLRVDDPAEYAIKLYETQQAIASYDAYQNDMSQRYESWRSGQFDRHVEAEADKLYSRGDWSEEKTASAAEAIRSLGYEEREMKQFVDARVIRGAQELSSLRKEVVELKARLARGEQAAKKVKRTVPRTLKPSVQRKELNTSQKKIKSLQSRLRKSRTHKDAGELIAAQLMES